jgi:MYXO-CTERM domain-containing protein
MRALHLAALLLLAAPAGAVEFRQPVNGDSVVTAYYDLGGTQDYNCGDNTYRGHRGTDIAIIGRFVAQDQGRDVMAGAAGRVTRTLDGEFDRCTTADCPGGGGYGNHVVIAHDDGKVSYYAHLRRGSVAVAEGDQVRCGQLLGQVGSSGHSTGPHLHFEVRVGGSADDPFTGPCGGPQGWWVEQGPYRGLPTRDCADDDPPQPPPAPDLHLAQRWAMPDRPCDFDDCRDFVRDGASAGVPDAWVGEETRWEVVIHNRGDGATAAETPEDAAVELAYALPEGLQVTRYRIESDHPAYDQATWAPNDAMDNPANPPAEALPQAGVLRLNGYSPNEAKRVTFWLRAEARTIDAGDARARAWVQHVRNYYGEKNGWDDAIEVNTRQTFNGGDLRVEGRVDVFDQRAFLFDAPDDAQVEGWRICSPGAVGTVAINQPEGALAIEVIGAAPCVESPQLRVPLAALAGVRLRVRQHQAPRYGWLAWTTTEAPEFSADRRVAVPTTGGGAFDALHLAPGWSGTLTRLRLSPVPDAGNGTPWFDVAALELVADAPAPTVDAGIEPPSWDAGPPATIDAGRPAVDDAGRPNPVADAGPPTRDDGGAGFSIEGARLSGGCRAAPGSGAGWAWALLLLVGPMRRRRRP